MAEDINIGAISEALNNKADRDFNNTQLQSKLDTKANKDLSNVPLSYDYVVQNYRAGSNWYKIYKSGWTEQGGVVTGSNPTVTLFVAMNQTNYHVTLSGIDEYAGERQITLRVNTRTGTSFSISNRSTSQTHYWEARGYKA